MPTPEFVLKLREKIGHDLLFLPGVRALVLNPAGQILLTHRCDRHWWALPAGILEPTGEQPEQALAREVLEETGVAIYGAVLLEVTTSDEREYPNGDKARFATITYSARTDAVHASACDDENFDAKFWDLDALPNPLGPEVRPLVAAYLTGAEE